MRLRVMPPMTEEGKSVATIRKDSNNREKQDFYRDNQRNHHELWI